jgi:uncharacterized protein YndB with AHSA1/START domain
MSQSQSSSSSSSSSNSETAHRDFESSLSMNASPEQVFDFISDIANLPKYLPTTKSAQPQGPERVRVQGEANGHKYDGDGYLRPNKDALRLEWGADEGYYNGWMQVEKSGNGSSVKVHISFRGAPPGRSEEDAPPPEQVQEGLDKSLQSIQNFVEGKGGKEEPSAAT